MNLQCANVWELQSAVDSSLTEGDLTANPNHYPHPRTPSPAATRSNTEVEEGGAIKGRKVFVLIFHSTSHTRTHREIQYTKN